MIETVAQAGEYMVQMSIAAHLTQLAEQEHPWWGFTHEDIEKVASALSQDKEMNNEIESVAAALYDEGEISLSITGLKHRFAQKPFTFEIIGEFPIPHDVLVEFVSQTWDRDRFSIVVEDNKLYVVFD